MKRIYLDSNVFISVFEGEIGRGVRGLFVEAELFLEAVKAGDNALVLSWLFFKEVQNRAHLAKEEVVCYFKARGIIVELPILITPLAWRDFTAIGMHHSDALHAAMALAYHCDCIVTFNIRHFEKTKSRIAVVEPGEFA